MRHPQRLVQDVCLVQRLGVVQSIDIDIRIEERQLLVAVSGFDEVLRLVVAIAQE